MVKLRCKECGYSFIPRSERLPSRCPYCAELNTLIEETGDALKDIEDMDLV